WNEWSPGFPESIDAKMGELPKDVQFDEEKDSDFKGNFFKAIQALTIDKVDGGSDSWKDISDFKKILAHYDIKNTLLGLDDFFLCQA
ncbi:hypothetical protein cypCar_00047853, partial [Cyprinus carpio]